MDTNDFLRFLWKMDHRKNDQDIPRRRGRNSDCHARPRGPCDSVGARPDHLPTWYKKHESFSEQTEKLALKNLGFTKINFIKNLLKNLFKSSIFPIYNFFKLVNFWISDFFWN